MKWWALALCPIMVGPAFAEEPGGLRSTLVIGGGFVMDDNPDFQTVPDSSVDPFVELRFGLTSETRRQSFEANGALDLRGGTVEKGKAALIYSIASSQSKLTAGLELDRLSSGGFEGTLETAVDEQPAGVVAIAPRGSDMTNGAAWLTFQDGLQRSVGYELDLRHGIRRFSDQGQNGNVDRSEAQAALVLRFSQLTEGRVEIGQLLSETAAPFSQSLRNTHAQVGLRHQIDRSTSLSFGLGHRRIRGDRGGRQLARSGAELTFGLQREMRDRRLYADVSVRQQVIGKRATARIGYERAGKAAKLSAWIGATHFSGGQSDLIGGLSYVQQNDTGKVEIVMDRTVGIDASSEDSRITDRLGLNWQSQLSANGSLNLRADYVRVGATAAGPARQGAGAKAVYRHALRSDWGVQVGLRYRVRQDGAGPKVSSRSMFLTLETQFEALH